MSLQKILLSICFCINIFIVVSQNGKLLSKELVEISTLNLGDDLFRFDGDSLRNEYKYLYKINLYNITYKSDELIVKGFLIEPKKRGKYPVIIFNRGGNRSFGKLSAQRMAALSVSEIASKGYVVIASNYRENDEYGGKDINDVLYLIETLKEVEKVDINRIGMFGWSRGGIMTYLALAKTDKIKTAVISNSPSNLYDVVSSRPIIEEKILSKYIPNYWKNRDEELKKRSVLYWAEKLNKKTKMLILCGVRDQRVNPSQADMIVEKLNKFDYDFEIVKFDTGHSFRSKKKELRELLTNWFAKKLKNI